MFGCDFTYPKAHDAEKGRGCVEYWLGFARARGIEILLPANTSLMDSCEPEAAEALRLRRGQGRDRGSRWPRDRAHDPARGAADRSRDRGSLRSLAASEPHRAGGRLMYPQTYPLATGGRITGAMYRPVLVAAPAIKPITLTEAKAALDISYTDKDTLIQGLIAAAIAHLDGWSGIARPGAVRADMAAGFRLLQLPYAVAAVSGDLGRQCQIYRQQQRRAERSSRRCCCWCGTGSTIRAPVIIGSTVAELPFAVAALLGPVSADPLLMQRRYDRQIIIQRKTLTQSGSGEPIETWADLCYKVFAFVAPTKGSEKFASPEKVASRK
jgi:hypothetical protein